ncbi:DNA topoisomerase 2-binding protein 1 [Lucilia sericata]|uniref:DNA topoisomerase 2-binding protein 1 n=1 Tax=Lucilia sericata TaxID=13632 RepID=UPI0018A7FA3C|nr:DNA topoisomerase 2-binding protein 1 [Lucilia sericata]
MSLDDSINAYFVITNNASEEDKAYKDFKRALTYLQNHIPEENIRQIKASEGFPLIASGRLSKKDVFIFDRFEGDFFQQLQQTKSIIIGPPCLINCLLKNQEIPLGTSPVYTAAMRDLQISATGITPQEKEKLKGLIQWMGGHYFQNFSRSITHLISNTIKSAKYEHATLNGIPVMHTDWVQRVWERSCAAEDISATDEEFDKYKLPIFFGTNITCTGLENDKKNEVMRLVNENGGTYHRAFRSQLVDIVITEKDKTNSEKYAAAVRYKKDILLPEWIFDSVQKGFALPTKPYQVKSLKVSTPTKTDQSIADFTAADNTHLSDISRISTLGSKRFNHDASTVNDTICSAMNDTQSGPTFVAPAAPVSKDLKKDLLKKAGSGTHYKLVYEEICPKKAKKAGSFLDGCCIYLSGFRSEEREKLNRILNVGGATRYDVVNEKITHIIVGQLDDNEFKSWKKDNLLTAVNIVRLDWLQESIKLKQPASEAIYRVSLPTSREPDAPSPSSKKTLRSMNHSFKQPEKPIKKKLFSKDSEKDDDQASQTNSTMQPPIASSTEHPVEADEQDLIAQYSQENVPQAAIPLPQTSMHNDESLAYPMACSTQLTANEPAVPQPQAAPVQANPSDLTDGTGITIDYENLDFFQGSSLYIDKDHFPEEFYTQMISECEAAQGNVVPSTFRDPVDYAIVSFENTFDPSQLPVKARHIVTELYVESCMKANKLVPIEYFHKHIPHTADSRPLEGMTIVISIYSLLERDFIDSIAQLLGANVNKTFVKKEKPLLICPSAEGSKYEGAIKWRYPVVTSEWLLQCAKEGKKVPYNLYLVGDSPDDFPISPTLRERNTSKTETKVTPTTPITPINMDVDGVENNVESVENLRQNSASTNTAETFTPLRNKRVSELAGPGRNTRQSLSNTNNMGPESPHTPTNTYPQASYNFDFMEMILGEIDNEEERECLREVINEMKNNQTPELERIRRQACTPINRKLPTPKGIPDFCTTPEFEKRMADEFERRWRLPTKKMKPDTPIDEIRRRVMRATCKAMGIPYSDEDDEQPGTSSGKKSSRKVIDSNTTTPLNNKVTRSSTIAPRSIFAHNTPNNNTSINNTKADDNETFNLPTNETRKSDTFVPSTQSPNTSLTRRSMSNTTASPSGLGQRASLVGKSTINFDKISFEETNVAENATTTKARPSVNATASPEIKQITDYLRNCDSRRQSLKRTRQNIDRPQSPVESMETEAHYVQPFESEQLHTQDLVGWRDPAEFGAQRRSKMAEKSMQYQGTPRFSISCSDEETRDDVIGKILQLGGEVCENLVNFDPECTHFVCEKPNRGEKMLGCISSGKWVLSIKYIEECFAKDVFIDEELYEWGNCKALNLPQLSPDEQVIASAAHRWRKQLATDVHGNRNGAFTGIKAILRISGRNIDALKNVIKAGKGEIIEASSPYSSCSQSSQASHCFVDVKKCPLNQEDYRFLKNHDIFVLSQMYINAFLMNGADVDMSKYEINM